MKNFTGYINMSCEYCHGVGWLLYKEEAPSPPYKQGQELEFAKRCVCSYESKGHNQNYQSGQN
jgi:hypothetical protein